jgi:RNA polymerase sigma-70 factor, ECF subfamily
LEGRLDQAIGTKKLVTRDLGRGNPRIDCMTSAVSLIGPSCDYRRSPYLYVAYGDCRKFSTMKNDSPEGRALDSESMAACIIAVAKSRDYAAFEALFRHFAPRIKSYLLKVGGDASVAEEVMQETMIMVWRKAGQFDPSKASASTWVFTIARNLRIEAFRRDRRPELDPDDPALAPETETPIDQVLAQQQSEAQLRKAMTSLSEDEQTLLKLSFYDDMSHSTISEKLGMPLGTVKSRFRLAYGKLRSALGERLGEQP